MNGRYKIHSELNFGIAKLDSEERSFDELYELAKGVMEDSEFPEVHFHLTDLRGCTFNFELSRLSDIVNLVEASRAAENQCIGVYLIDKPITTAYARLFFANLKHKRELCSSPEKAFSLLKLPVSYSEFLTLIDI